MATDLEYVNLADQVYNRESQLNSEGKIRIKSTLSNPRDMDNSSAVAKTWDVVKYIKSKSSGFSGAIFRYEKEFVFTFAGSNGLTDWTGENPLLYWNTPQTQEARRMINDFLTTTNFDLTQAKFNFVGHSLGGKLAQAMLVEATDGLFSKIEGKIGRGIIFNGAPVQRGLNRSAGSDYEPKYIASSYNVDHYILKEEILNNVVGSLGTHFGRQHRLAFAYRKPDGLSADNIPAPNGIARHNAFSAFSYAMNNDGNFMENAYIGTSKREGTEGDDVIEGNDVIEGTDASETFIGGGGMII